MKKSIRKLFTQFFVICYVAGLLFQFTPSIAEAENAEPATGVSSTQVDPDNMTSTEMAKDWGFATDVVPESSKKRQESDENPAGANKNTVKTFGETPLEIAVVGGELFKDDDIQNADYDDRNNISFYDHFKLENGSIERDPTRTNSGDSKIFSYDDNESNIMPSKTVAADIDGNGIDEVLRYCVYVDEDGEIGKFNDHKDDYDAYYKLQVIDSSAKVKNEINLRTLSSKEFDNIMLPEGGLEYSSYMQIAAGDFDSDGMDEVAVLVPGKDSSKGELVIYGGVKDSNGGITLKKEFTYEQTHYTRSDKMSGYYLAIGDADNDGKEELLYTRTLDLNQDDDNSSLYIFDYINNSYVKAYDKKIMFNGDTLGNEGDPVGNCGVTVGDIDNDGLNEVVVGGFMVNAETKDNKYTNKAANGKEDSSEYYHQLAMSYMEMEYQFDDAGNITSKNYGNYKGFTVFRNEWKTAWTSGGDNDTSYDNDHKGRYKHSKDWMMQIIAVSLSGNVNGKTNDQIFFGNFMYYFDTLNGRFLPYDDKYESKGSIDTDMVVYKDIDAPDSSITGLFAGSFLSDDPNYVPAEGKEQLLVSYVRRRDKNHEYSHEIALYHENTGSETQKDVEKNTKSLGQSEHIYRYYPNVCAPNIDTDATFIQYSGYEFAYTKPEVLNVIAAAPYFEDVLNYNDYAGGGNYNPGITYIRKTSGTSSTKGGFTEFKLGAYCSFSQDVGIFGIKILSLEMERSFSLNTSFEYRNTIEHSSSISYSTDGGQDSAVVVSAPQDTYFYRYYKDIKEFHDTYPGAVESDTSTWPIMAVNIPGAPQPRVIPVATYNKLADTYKLDKIDNDFWEHTNGDPGTYPKSKNAFKNAGNVLSTEQMSLNEGSGGVSAEVSVTETQEEEYSVSLTNSLKFGAGAGGAIFGITFENTIGYKGVEAQFKDTTFGADLGNFLGDGSDPEDLRTGYSLTTQLHSYTKEFNGNKVVVLDYTVNSYTGRPKLPNDFRIKDLQGSKVTLAWDIPEAISDGLRPDSIELQRYDEFYKKYLTIKSFDTVTLGDTVTYEDTGVYPEENYKYRLKVLKLSKENYLELSVQTPPYGVPAQIYKHPLDTTVQTGSAVTFSLEAGLPEYADPTRLYYEWYKRNAGEKTWTRVEAEGVPESNTLTLDNVTLDMDGMQFYCAVSRMIKNSSGMITTSSDFAQLNVLGGVPQKYRIDFGTVLNGTVQAVQLSACGREYPVNSGDALFQGTRIKYTAVPAKGYRISSWVINGIKKDASDNPNYICSLNGDSTVSAVFETFLYNVYFDVIPNNDQNQGTETWGSLKAISDRTELPIGETTVLNSRMPVIFTAAPEESYAVDYWTLNGEIIKNADGSNFIGKTYTFNPIDRHAEIEVRFMKSENYNIKVVKSIIGGGITYIDDSLLDISVDGANNKDVAFNGSEAVLPVARGSEAVINVVPPASSILDSWAVDGVPQKVDVPSLTLSDIAKDTTIYLTYKIFFSKLAEFTTSGAEGAVTAVLKSDNSEDTKPIISGTPVQMDQYAELTAQSEENLGIKTWLVNGKDMQSNDNPFKVKIVRNTTIASVLEAAPKPKEPGDKVNITGPVTQTLSASDLAFDPDGDSVVFDSISAAPDAKVAVAILDPGTKLINITAVDQGSTAIKVVISDGKKHSLEVEVPIVVVNANQEAPTGLKGVEVTGCYIANGKITGFDASRIYEYRNAGSSEYLTFTGGTELEFLEAGEYKVRYAAIKGYNASPDLTVKVPSYRPVYFASICANPFDGGTAEGSSFYLEGTKVTAHAQAKPGFTFEGWWDGMKTVGTEPEYTFVTGSKNTVLEARFKPVDSAAETGNVKTSAAIMGSQNSSVTGIILNGAGDYKAGDSVTVSVYGHPESCEFAYWSEGDNIVSYNPDYEFIQPAGNRNLTACFQKTAYNVTVSSSDQNMGTASGTDLYKTGSRVTVVAEPTEQSLFDCWTIDGEVIGKQNKLTFTMMPEDIRIVAHFKPLSHMVSLNANPNWAGTVTGGKLYSESDPVTITAAAKDGYEFVGWTEEGITVSDKPEYTFNLGESDRCLVADFLKAFTVTFDKNDGSQDAALSELTAAYGKTVKNLPSSPVRPGYKFKNWNTSADGTGKAFSEATPVTGDITVYAQWETGTSTNGSGSTYTPSGVNPDTQPQIVIQPEEIIPNAPYVKSENGITIVIINTAAGSKSTGTAETTVSTGEISEAVSQADKKALETGDSRKSVTVDVYSPDNTTVVEISMDKEALKLLSDSKIDTLSINTKVAVLDFDGKAIDSILEESSGNIKFDLTGCSTTDIAGLPDEQINIIGSRPVYVLSVKSGGKLISDFNGNVLVTVPYSLKQGDDPNAIVIYRINDKNELEAITDSVYNSGNRTVTFSTDRLSRYAVCYNKADFKDVSDTAWYKDAVTFAFARGITTGTGKCMFNPDGNLTRAQFLVMVMRAYGLGPESNPANNFADAGNTYYSGYLAKAKTLNLSQGTGGNLFLPEQLITREEMFTLLYNILKYLDKLPTGTGTKNIFDFSDADKISQWGVEGMTLFVKAGIINGDNGLLMPKAVSSRAQMVQILFKLLCK